MIAYSKNNKRLIGVVTVLNGMAVQSIGYSKYLPLGDPIILIKNLDRWQVDEILVQVIDRSMRNPSNESIGPDIDLVERVSKIGISTPLIYGGGIRDVVDAVALIRAGADRLCLESIVTDNVNAVEDIARVTGAQALIISMPLKVDVSGEIMWYCYRTKDLNPIPRFVMNAVKRQLVSEVMLVDVENDGDKGSFDTRLLKVFDPLQAAVIAFGGVGRALEDSTIKKVIANDDSITAVAMGNRLNYQEHAAHKIRSNLLVGMCRKVTVSNHPSSDV